MTNVIRAMAMLAMAPLAFASGTAEAGVIANYEFNGNAIDDVGGHNGTVGNATLVNDRFGAANGAYSLSHTGYIDVGNYGFAGGSATYSVWASLADTFGTADQGQVLFNTNGDSGTVNLYFFSGCGQINWNTGDTCANALGAIPATAIDGHFHNYTTVLDSGAGTATLYYDGALLGSAGYRAPGNVLLIGNFITGANPYGWDGAIDKMTIYNTALTGNEVASAVAADLGSAVPEPASLALLASGVFGLVLGRRRRAA